MISVVCVFNDRHVLDDSLVGSLLGQAKHEVILLDNVAGTYLSAATALNAGAKRAKGKYVMFVHQDVELVGAGWLDAAERCLEKLPRLGMAGVIGMNALGSTRQERLRGCAWGGEVLGRPLREPEEVQTVDEIVLIVPRAEFLGFDEETFDGWHCYGADYCLTMIEQGRRVYVIPGYVFHGRKVSAPAGEEGVRQLWRTLKSVRFYLKRLYRKHGKHFERIYTTTNGTGKYGVPLVLLWNERVFSVGFRLWRVLRARRIA